MDDLDGVIKNGYMDHQVHDIIYPYDPNNPIAGRNAIRWNNQNQSWEVIVVDTTDPRLA